MYNPLYSPCRRFEPESIKLYYFHQITKFLIDHVSLKVLCSRLSDEHKFSLLAALHKLGIHADDTLTGTCDSMYGSFNCQSYQRVVPQLRMAPLMRRRGCEGVQSQERCNVRDLGENRFISPETQSWVKFFHNRT